MVLGNWWLFEEPVGDASARPGWSFSRCSSIIESSGVSLGVLMFFWKF